MVPEYLEASHRVVQSRVRATALAQGKRAKRRGSSPSEAPLRKTRTVRGSLVHSILKK